MLTYILSYIDYKYSIYCNPHFVSFRRNPLYHMKTNPQTIAFFSNFFLKKMRLMSKEQQQLGTLRSEKQT